MRPAAAILAALAITAGTGKAQAADEARAAFVADVMLATFYHEFGHALIDLHGLPVLGREEDAADALAALLMDVVWEPDSAETMLRHAALAWQLSDARAEAEGETPAYWDVHALDLQRYYNQVCLFYGAAPETRADLARTLDLPEERAETCAEEYDQAAHGWGPTLEAMENAGRGRLIFVPPAVPDDLADLLAAEVREANAAWHLPTDLTLRWEACGEANAFYDPDGPAIVMCRELAVDLGDLWDRRNDLLP